MANLSSTFTPFGTALNTARQALYHYFALAAVDPRNGSWQSLTDPELQRCVEVAAEYLQAEPLARAAELGLGERSPAELDPQTIFALMPPSPEALNAEYERTFGLLVSGQCPPYETEYINEKFTFQRSQHLADLAGFYRAFGMGVSTTCPERHDHLVLELEFMSVLIGLEQRAGEDLQCGDEHAITCRQAQQKFLGEHLAWWVPTFSKLLANENPDSFYAALGSLLSAFVPVERTLLEVEPPNMPVKPSMLERPEECEGCLLQN